MSKPPYAAHSAGLGDLGHRLDLEQIAHRIEVAFLTWPPLADPDLWYWLWHEISKDIRLRKNSALERYACLAA